MQKDRYSLGELASLIGAEVRGDAHCEISGLASLEKARQGEISFLVTSRYQMVESSRYEKFLPLTKASAVLLAPANIQQCPASMLIMEDTYQGLISLASLFQKKSKPQYDIHPTVVIGKNTRIGSNVTIGPYCVIGDDCDIGEDTWIESNTVVGDNVRIGKACHFFSNTTLCHDISLGDRVVIYPGAVIGGDGFGMVRNSQGWKRMPHLGSVRIGNDVEIGANTTIDRGAIDDTILENGVKLDNQIQLAHGVVIGENTVIAACVGIGGSTHIGKNCMIGGAAGIIDNVTIADNVILTAAAQVSKSITQPGIYSSGTGLQTIKEWHKSVARFRGLDDLARKLRKLEKEKDE